MTTYTLTDFRTGEPVGTVRLTCLALLAMRPDSDGCILAGDLPRGTVPDVPPHRRLYLTTKEDCHAEDVSFLAAASRP